MQEIQDEFALTAYPRGRSPTCNAEFSQRLPHSILIYNSKKLTTLADTETPNKYLYSIGEVAEMFNLNTSAIRYWEKEFDIIKPHRNKKGNRLFTQEDVKNFRIIYHLVKERKMRIEGVKRKLSTSKEEIVNNIEIIDKLKSIKSLLLQISNEIDGDEN